MKDEVDGGNAVRPRHSEWLARQPNPNAHKEGKCHTDESHFIEAARGCLITTCNVSRHHFGRHTPKSISESKRMVDATSSGITSRKVKQDIGQKTSQDSTEAKSSHGSKSMMVGSW